MNVLFVNYHDFTSNSVVHIFNLANELTGLGVDCAVGVPGDPATIGLLGTPRFQALGFDEAKNGGLRFPDGGPPSLVHAWTPRESVRELTENLARATAARTSSISRTTRTCSPPTAWA